ncbi:Protein RTF2 -like protein [Trametes pubescens]|uniref:Protein RTF2-like protein n=1 Tax=Trametes pubescens TaxID=154538 RepID=A0A1M2VZ48_TRAPU|nr:Protein RTF2 -like protein [Trametes pubescens]
MGNDGGSIPDRRDLVRTKAKAEQADKANQVRAMWFFCALSKRPLQEPVVSCPLGKLYNKDALLEFLLDRTSFGDGEEICGHIRSLKDVKVLKLTPNPTKTTTFDSSSDSAPTRAPFVCPLNLKEMNGVQPFVYLATCGCVFSQGGLKAVCRSASSKTPPTEVPGDAGKGADSEQAKDLDLCPQCGAKYDRAFDVRMLNPPVEVEEQMRAAMEARRAAEPVKTKGKGKKRKAAADAAAEPPVKKQAMPSTNPSIAAASRGVAASLAEEEARRKAGMSDAVKSLYTSKDGPKKKETFMTMGTFTR